MSRCRSRAGTSREQTPLSYITCLLVDRFGMNEIRSLKHRIIARAEQVQRAGHAGNAIKVHILAAEVKTIREGPERTHS